MRTESDIKYEGMKVLLDKLGKVDAERFVAIILREPFNYTVWRETLQNENITLRDLSRRAMSDFIVE